MKKIFFFVVIIFILGLTNIVHAESFSLISSSFYIDGRLTVSLPKAPPWVNGDIEGFNFNSTTPISDAIIYPQAFLKSGASYNNVYTMISAIDGMVMINDSAFAKTTLYFSPNFIGQGSIGFIQENWEDPGYHSNTRITIDDITINSRLFVADIYTSTTLNITTNLEPFVYLDTPFIYNEWNSDHQYKLIMYSSSGVWWDGEQANSSITTNMIFTNVPEPLSIMLVVFGLIGIVGINRKLKQ
jgi:hypothetical protein